MAAKKSSKTPKRLARQWDRDFAARLAAVYDAGYCDGDVLSKALDIFARYGTFEAMHEGFEAAKREMRCRDEFKRLRDENVKVEDAIGEIVKRYGYGERTVRGIVYSNETMQEAMARLAKKFP